MLAESNRKGEGMRRTDRLGVLLTLIGGIAVLFQSFVLFKANRIVPGESRALLDVLPPWAAVGCYVVLAVAAVTAIFVTNPRARLCVALGALAVVAVTVAAAASALTPPGTGHQGFSGRSMAGRARAPTARNRR
jgi:osmoprotectant transport system permease protein